MASQDASNRLQFLWNASHTFLSTVPSLSAFYMQQFNLFAAERELNLAEAVKRNYCSYCGNIFLPGLNSQVRVETNKKRSEKKLIDKEAIPDHNSVGQPGESNVSKIKQKKNSQKKRQIIYIYPSNYNNNPKSTIIDYQKQTHTKRQHYKNYVSYVCNSCNRETRFAGSVMGDIKQISSVKQQKEDTSNFTTSISQASILHKIPSSLSAQDKSSHCKKKKKKQKKMQLKQLLAEEKRNSSGKRDDFNDFTDGLNLANFLSAL